MLNNYEGVAEDLKGLHHWIIHKDKVPLNPVTKEKDDYTNKDICVSFEKAIQASVGVDGIGFCFFNTGLVGIDIDTCREPETGKISKEALKIINYLDSYTEISPSGYGVHIYVFSEIHALPFHKKSMRDNGIMREVFNKKTGQHEFKRPEIEFYKEKRYFTVTGNVLDNFTIIRQRANKLQKVLNYFGNKNNHKTKAIETNENYGFEESEILESMFSSSKGNELRKLYYGDITKYDDDDSRADLALCNALMFYSRRDIPLADKLFRGSGIMRDKWDEKRGDMTYGEMTLKKAAEDCVNVYNPAKYKKNEEQLLKISNYDELKWEKPKLLEDTVLPEFPISCLPKVLGDYCEAVSESLQSHLDIAAVASLPIIGQCVQGKFIIEGKKDWQEPLNLYVSIVANPAEKKSPTLKKMIRYVREYEGKAKKEMDAEIEKSKIEKELLENEIDILKKQAVKKPDLKVELLEKQEELSNFVELKPIQYIVDDVTPEALVELLEENQGKIALISSEGGIFDIMNGKYTGSVSVSHFLKAHSGDPIIVNRKNGSKKKVTIPEPALTMLLCFQPTVLSDVFSNDTFKGQGLNARFLYSIPKSSRGCRKFDTQPIPKEISRDYKKLCVELMDIPMQQKPSIISLSDGAREVFKQSYEKEHKLLSDNENLCDWIGKLHGHFLRIAGIIHVAEHKSNSVNNLVSRHTMISAMKIGHYFLEHAKFAYSQNDIASELAGARYILKNLGKQKKKILTKYEIFRCCRKFSKVENMEEALGILTEYGYLKTISEDRKGETAGRNPEPRFALNPLFFQVVSD